MRGLVQAYPDDLDAATLYAESLMNLHPWQLWAQDGTPDRGHARRSSRCSSRCCSGMPNHVGANHYYIHAVEASLAPDRALPSAKKLETLVPAAGHLVHMPAHTYMRTGDYLGAVTANAARRRSRSRYIAATKRRRLLSDDVLQPQPRLPGVGGDDDRPVRRSQQGGRRK